MTDPRVTALAEDVRQFGCAHDQLRNPGDYFYDLDRETQQFRELVDVASKHTFFTVRDTFDLAYDARQKFITLTWFKALFTDTVVFYGTGTYAMPWFFLDTDHVLYEMLYQEWRTGGFASPYHRRQDIIDLDLLVKTNG